jgi:hypothetical protein
MANQNVTDLAKWREQQLENFGGVGHDFELTWSDKVTGEERHETFTVNHPLSLEEDQNDAVDAAKGTVALAKALLNTEADPDRHSRFIAAGGRSGDVLIAWRQMTQEMNGPK